MLESPFVVCYNPWLVIFLQGRMFPPCQFTNFIAESASGTANSWCVRASGRGRNAHTAARRGFRRGSPYSHHPVAAVTTRHPALENPVPAACATPDARTLTDR